MTARLSWCYLASAIVLVGCRANIEVDPPDPVLSRGHGEPEAASRGEVGRGESAANGYDLDLALAPSQIRLSDEVPGRRLPCDGLWVPSGWMGDAETPDGPLRRTLCSAEFRSAPSCEHWIYTPTPENTVERWCGVAYQYPPGRFNFGMQAGKDLSGQGFTHVTFWAKSASAKLARIVVSSGGHTSPNSPYPATYQVELGLVELDSNWRKVSIPIAGLDHKNVTCAMGFSLLADDGPCEFLIDDLAFERQ